MKNANITRRCCDFVFEIVDE